MPLGDLAADMLLGNAISRDGILLVGHYSRWQFNHPGPFWFYLNQGFEWVLREIDFSRFQVWVIGSVVTNAILVTAGSISFSRFILKRQNAGFTLFFAALWIGFCGTEITLLWMPWRIVAPYLCFLIAVLYLSEGRGSAFFLACFLAGTLIHGYVTMPLFTLPLLFWGLWAGQRKSQFLSAREFRLELILGAMTLLCFAFPILWEAMGTAPSNLSRILEAQSFFRGMQRPDAREVLSFGMSLLRLEQNAWGWMGCLSFLVLLPKWIRAPREQRRLISKVCVLLGVLALGIFGYYARTPSPLHPFVAQFFVIIPVILLGAWGSLAFQCGEGGIQEGSGPWGKLWRLAPLVLVSCLFLLGLQRPPRMEPSPLLLESADALSKVHPDELLALHDTRHEGWPLMAGLLLEIQRRGIPVCTTDWDGELIFTKFHLCPAGTIPQFEWVPETACDGECLYRGEGQGLRSVEIPVLLPHVTMTSQEPNALFLNWNESPQGVWWSAAKSSSIVFQVDEPAAFEGLIDLQLSTIGPKPQRVVIAWNGREIFNDRIAKTRSPFQIRFPAEWIRSGPNSLSFELPDARRPSAEDLRWLALKVTQIVIH